MKNIMDIKWEEMQCGIVKFNKKNRTNIIEVELEKISGIKKLNKRDKKNPYRI